MPEDRPEARPSHFLREIVARDVAERRDGGRVATRFPPEPNGYPHIGHAQSICLNFGLAADFGGTCVLRYDDTNPETERHEFVEALEDAVRWLGFAPAEIRFASDYFEQLYAWAQDLVRRGLAYVDSQSEDAIRAGRGTVTEPGTPSPFRDRAPEESLRLLEEMRRGEHPDGAHVLRARIDTEHGPMAHPNMKLRDPVMYRIRRGVPHYRRGTDWAIYPLYDWAHGQSDAIEGITHSVCTLEFDVNRPLYDWYLDALGIPNAAYPVRPRQHEFARFNLAYGITSKRRLRQLVEEGRVSGWDDPRMPTIAGMRRRGVRPEALRAFFDRLGVTKVNGRVELAQYEHALRDDLNAVAPRVMAVARPLRLTITNLGAPRTLPEAPLWPHDVTPPRDAPRTRPLVLAREVWIEADDFAEAPPRGWRRLAPGAEVRLRHGPVVRCTGVERGPDGRVTGLTAEADLATLGAEPEGRRVRGVIHWVAASTARPARFRLYDRLFTDPAPDEREDFLAVLNPDSLVETAGFVEPWAADAAPGTRFQFERQGYFWPDPVDSRPDALVFNRIVALRDGFAREVAPASSSPRPEPEPRPEPGPEPGQESRAAPPPRDPAAALSAPARARYDALVARGVGEEEAAVLAADDGLAALFEAIAGAGPREAGVLIVHALRPALPEQGLGASQASPEALADVLRLQREGTLTAQGVREAVAALVTGGGTAAAVVQAHGLAAVRDDAALRPAVEEAIATHPEEAARFRAGETRLLGFLTGQAMRRAGRGADARRVQELLRELLSV
ncbi:MAG: glutamine--tRNA ligase/YqeY domain fusion protein [Rubricoccaceae bacterium]